jgi:hypothetical protein
VDAPSQSWPSLNGYGSTRSPNDVEYGPGPSLSEGSEEGEDLDDITEEERRRSSGEPWLFPSPDNDLPTPSGDTTLSPTRSKDSDPTPRPGMLTLTSPKPPPEPTLGTSLNSVASRPSVRRLGAGSYGFGNAVASGSGSTHPGQRAYEGISPRQEVAGVDEAVVADAEGAIRADEEVILDEGVLGERGIATGAKNVLELNEGTPLLSKARRRSSARSRRLSRIERGQSDADIRRRQSFAPKGESTEGQTVRGGNMTHWRLMVVSIAIQRGRCTRRDRNPIPSSSFFVRGVDRRNAHAGGLCLVDLSHVYYPCTKRRLRALTPSQRKTSSPTDTRRLESSRIH